MDTPPSTPSASGPAASAPGSGEAGPPPPTLPVPVRLSSDGTAVVILDQTALPEREEERTLRTVEEVEEAIRSLRVRGAPLIGITAALGVAALARGALEPGVAGGRDGPGLARRVRGWCRRLAEARPTAVNLAWAMERMEAVVDRGEPTRAAAGSRESGAGSTAGGRERGGDAAALADRLEAEARRIHDEDRAMCRRIGQHALELLGGGDPIDPADPAGRGNLTVLTHCNTGALATGGMGTALAPVYLAHQAGRRVRVFADETRPLLQGSRLTAWELRRAGVDVTVLADATAGALMAGEGRPDAVLVGADRIAANGDVANKVGTYGLAVLARHHGVPFYVLAPTTTVDLGTADGAAIPIEHRDADEVRRGFGRLTAPEDTAVWSPAFDVTPADLVTAIVTERGVHRPPWGPALHGAVEAAEAERRAAGRADRRTEPAGDDRPGDDQPGGPA